MIGDGQVAIVGTLRTDPEIRFTERGQAVARLQVATASRTVVTCKVWGVAAEHVAETLNAGAVVLVRGYLTTRGQQGCEITVEHIGISLTAHRPVRMVGGAQ